MFYCTKCREKVNSKNAPDNYMTSNGKAAITGNCEKCNTKVFKFVKKS